MGNLQPKSLAPYAGALKVAEMSALASRGFVFESHRSSSTFANGAMAALLSGRPSRSVRVDDDGARLPRGITTIADAARQAGIATAMFTATAQVYFRDLTNFLPYFTRIWLYTSPILFYAEDVPDKLRPILYCNPMYPMLGSLNYAVIEGRTPPAGLLLASFAWAMAAIVAGTLFFISREREFAIRI